MASAREMRQPAGCSSECRKQQALSKSRRRKMLLGRPALAGCALAALLVALSCAHATRGHQLKPSTSTRWKQLKSDFASSRGERASGSEEWPAQMQRDQMLRAQQEASSSTLVTNSTSIVQLEGEQAKVAQLLPNQGPAVKSALETRGAIGAQTVGQPACCNRTGARADQKNNHEQRVGGKQVQDDEMSPSGSRKGKEKTTRRVGLSYGECEKHEPEASWRVGETNGQLACAPNEITF